MITDRRLIQLVMNEVEPLYVMTAMDILASPPKERTNLEILLVIQDGQYHEFVDKNRSNTLTTRIYKEMKKGINNMRFTLPPDVRIYHQPMNIFADEISRLHLHSWKESTNRSAKLFWNCGTIIYPPTIGRDEIIKACCDYSEEMASG